MPIDYDTLLVAFDREPEEAIDFLKSKGIAITWDWKEQLELTREHVFTVAKVLCADVLESMKSELERALERGTPYEEWRNRVEGLLQQKGFARRADGSAWRLDTVYRTNLQSAYMAARDAAMREVAEEFPWWEYVSVVDRRTRPVHMTLNGVIRRYDDPFWSSHNPPLGYRCRCRKRSYSDAQMKRLGKKETANPPTESADKGFGKAPSSWKPDTSKYHPSIAEHLRKHLSKPINRNHDVDEKTIRQEFTKAIGRISSVFAPPKGTPDPTLVHDPGHWEKPENADVIGTYTSGEIRINPKAVTDKADIRRTVYHEYGHHLMDNLGLSQSKKWVNFESAVKASKRYKSWKEWDEFDKSNIGNADDYWSDTEEVMCRLLEVLIAERSKDTMAMPDFTKRAYFNAKEQKRIAPKFYALIEDAGVKIINP